MISCIMPVYNGEKYITGAIDSFINQNYLKKELIIVGNKSTDKSNLIIKKYVNKYPNYIKWINVADKGISNAYNIGLKKAKGKYICYLGADDILCGGIFTRLNEFVKLKLDLDILYFDSYNFFIKSNKFILRSYFSNLFKLPLNKDTLLKNGSIVGLQNIVFSKNILMNNFLDEKNKYSMDYEILLRLLTNYKNDLRVFPVNLPFSVNLQYKNISQSKKIEQHNEMLKVAGCYSKSIYQKFLVKILFFKIKICELLIILKFI